MNDEEPVELEFPSMNSFYRMLAHHVAAYYGLGHFVDVHTRCLVLRKQEGSHCPALKLYDMVEPAATTERRQSSPTQHFSPGDLKIMRRSTPRMASNASEHEEAVNGSGSKSIEEREAEYQAARERIFSTDIEVREVSEEVKPSEGELQKTMPDLNPEAEPFDPNFPTEDTQAKTPAFKTRTNLNIIDPSVARAPGHILVIRPTTDEILQRVRLLFVDTGLAASRVRDPHGSYLIFNSTEVAKDALKQHALDLHLAPWLPLIQEV